MKFIIPILLFSLCLNISVKAQKSEFEKDRNAILGMAGNFKVKFNFQETLSLKKDYQINQKKYEESAHETVIVAEDTGNKIVLQHLLLAGKMVVKHWTQTWIYEDQTILVFEGDRTWSVKKFSPEEVRGKWSQSVGQVDDSPRYESYGSWTHHKNTSEWSAACNRPLPRREAEARKDYDLLIGTNRHTVSENLWYHEQDNAKWARRENEQYPLCREKGLNTYERISDFDFSPANEYWKKTASYWQEVRNSWEAITPNEGHVKFLTKANGARLMEMLGDKAEDVLSGDNFTKAEILDKIKHHVLEVKSL